MKRRKSTRRKKNILDLVDRISALPDCILGRILSHLPTKNAVATAILSKRWKFVWMTVHNLDFCLDGWMNYVPEDEVMKFILFVNRVLRLLDGRLLNKFRLVWRPRFIPSQVSSWITTAITRNVHDLSVCVWVLDRLLDLYDDQLLKLPACVFSADSLRCLELNGGIFVPAEIVVCLPRLETLKLFSVYFQSKDAFEKLICGCPKLNYLHIDVDYYYMIRCSDYGEVFTFIISSTSLRRLEVYVLSKDRSTRILELEASSLEYFKLVGPISKVIVKGCLNSLVEADFRIHKFEDEYIEYNYDPHVETVRAFDCAKAITLSADAMWALSHGTICLSTKFSRLTKLEAGGVCYCSSLQEFIQNSDSLEVLTIYQEPTYLGEYDHNSSTWTAPVEVPRCLSNSLKEVSFEGYAGFDNEREMIGYMLKHGSVLEVMHVTCNTYEKGVCLDLHKEICRFPRKSPACKVEFIEGASMREVHRGQHFGSTTVYYPWARASDLEYISFF